MKHALPPLQLIAITVVVLLCLSLSACAKKKDEKGAMPKDPCKASVDRMIKCTAKNNEALSKKMAEKRATMLELCKTNELSNKKARKCAPIRGCDPFMKCLDSDL